MPGMNGHDSFFGLKVKISFLPIRQSKDKNKHLALALMILQFVMIGKFAQQLFLFFTVLLLNFIDGGDIVVSQKERTDVGKEDLLSLAF